MKTTNKFIINNLTFFCMLLLFVCNNNLFSQIIYTDPTDATPNATYNLDLNNDSVVDFTMYFGGGSGIAGVQCAPQNNNAYLGDFVNGTHLPWALNSSTSICATSTTWYGTNYPGTLGLGSTTGYWPGATDKYLALKLIVGTNTYYGWARFDVYETSTSFTLKDYAYESTPNACILSGQTGLGTLENAINHPISIYPNPMVSSTTLVIDQPLDKATLTIYNSFGQAVKKIENISSQTFSLSRDSLEKGVYLLKFTEENQTIAVTKLVIKD